MAASSAGNALTSVRLFLATLTPPDAPDRELLDRFVRNRDQAAFASLVHRHGAMVLHTCRRMLRNTHDAEDACQATFLILAQKASGIRKRDALGSWLHGVAIRVARDLRAKLTRRAARPLSAATGVASPQDRDPLTWNEVRAALDEELSRLPEHYRAALVLCYLEGRSRDEAAQQLGWSLAALRGKLERGRALLHARLVRRGLTLSATLVASALAHNAAAGAVPARLFLQIVRSAAGPVGGGTAAVSPHVLALANGAVTAMIQIKRKYVLVLALAIVFGISGYGAYNLYRAEATPQAWATGHEGVPAADGPRPAEQAPASVDLYGDPLPVGVVARLGTVRFRHGSQVMGVAFAPDGKTIMSCSYDRTFRVWEAHTGREMKRFPDSGGSFTALCAAADGKTIVARTYTGELRHFDVASGRQSRLDPILDFGKSGLALSPDGKTLAALIGPTVRLIDVRTNKPVGAPWGGHKANARAVAYSVDGKYLASGDEDGLVLLRDAVTGAEKRRFGQEENRPVLAIAFSPDGQTLAAGGGKGESEKLRLWDVPSGKLLHELGAHYPAVESIAFSSDGKVMASAGSGGKLYLWEAGSGKKLSQIWAYAQAIAFAPDGKALATAGNDRTIRFWEVPTGKERAAPADGHRGTVQTVAVSKDGAVVATAGGYDNSIRLWDIASSKELRRIGAASNGIVGVMALSPDGKTVTTDKGSWETATGRSLFGLKGRTAFLKQEYSIEAIAYSPGGKTLAMATREGNAEARNGRMIRLWDATTAAELRHFGTQAVRALAYSPDGKIVAAGNDDGTVGLWDVGRGHEQRRIAAHARDVNSVAFSPDGKILASCTYDGDIRLWDASTGKVAGQIFVTEHVRAITFAPNGKALVAAGQPDLSQDGACISLWELSTGRPRLRLTGHQGDVVSLAFAGGSRFLTSGSDDTTALVWDLTGPARPAPTRAELDGLWDDLRSRDAERAYGAVCRLARSAACVNALEQRLPPTAAPPAGDQVARLIKSLDSVAFDERERASQELAQLGEGAEATIRKELAGKPSLELRRRLRGALERLSVECLRTERAVEALELAATPEAKQVLRSMAKGPQGARRTLEAKAAIERLRVTQSANDP